MIDGWGEPDEAIAARLRADTPGADAVVHLNAAGAGLPAAVVTRAVIDHVQAEARIGPHWAAAAAETQIEAARGHAARLFGCAPGQIAFGESASRLWALIMASVPMPRGARILVSRSEWVGNILNVLKRARGEDLAVEVMPVGADGTIDVEALGAMLDERVAAICVSAVASANGTRQPAGAIGRLARPERCLYFLDASQAMGRFPLSLPETSADVMVTPSRKWLRGPRGQAIAALSPRALAAAREPVLLDQHGAPWTGSRASTPRETADRFETYEFSVAGRIGLGVAIDYALGIGLDAIDTVVRHRLRRAHGLLSRIGGCRVHEDIDRDPAFLTFSVPDERVATVVAALRAANVAVAMVGEDYARWELAARGLTRVLRVAPHGYTSEADLDQFAEIVTSACAGVSGGRTI